MAICYNRDFYCVQIHDEEVACDGLLFNNVFEVPMIMLSGQEYDAVTFIINQIAEEFAGELSLKKK